MDSWSQLDFVIVVLSLVDMLAQGVNLSAVKVLRLLRTLRPLRFIQHNKNMRLVVSSIIESGSGLFNISIITFMLWLMFGIFGVSLMRGRLHYCLLPASYPYENF